MHDAGFSNFDALVAATRNGADALGLADRLGTITAGRDADLVVLDKNPLDDIDNLSSVLLVMKRGRLFTPPAAGGTMVFSAHMFLTTNAFRRPVR